MAVRNSDCTRMASPPPQPILSLLSFLGKWLMLLAVVVAVSGAPGHIVQGIAWWSMAEKDGGIDQLSHAMFDAEPCHLCHLAQDLSQESDPESPNTPERFQLLRTIAVIADPLSVPPANSKSFAPSHRPAASEITPDSRRDRPDLPPPRGVA